MKKLLLVLFLFITSMSFAQQTDVNKYKSLFTVNFIKFIGWTEENKKGDFVIGVVKSQNIADYITINTKGKQVGYQKFIVKNFNNIDEITDCQLLYISNNQYLNSKNIDKIKSKVSATPTLIITETNNGTNIGSMINFVIVDNKLRFEIDILNIESSGLKISNALRGLNNAIVK